MLLLTFNFLPLPSDGNLHFHVPDFYILSIPISLTIVLIFLSYFGFRFGYEARKRGNALSRLELVLAKEQELESIGHQAAAAAHSLGTPLSTITVIATELKKENYKDKSLTKDIDILLEQAKNNGVKLFVYASSSSVYGNKSGKFSEDDVLVLNDTRVFPARLYGLKEKTGAKIEVFLLRELNPELNLWDVLVDPARKRNRGNQAPQKKSR